MSEEPEKGPEGCVGCNPEEIEPMLEERGIQVESVPTSQHGWRDVIVCPKCGQAWLLMPRDDDVGKPVA